MSGSGRFKRTKIEFWEKLEIQFQMKFLNICSFFCIKSRSYNFLIKWRFLCLLYVNCIISNTQWYLQSYKASAQVGTSFRMFSLCFDNQTWSDMFQDYQNKHETHQTWSKCEYRAQTAHEKDHFRVKKTIFEWKIWGMTYAWVLLVHPRWPLLHGCR